jgi:DNA-binding beta-propeller fold protein YncE
MTDGGTLNRPNGACLDAAGNVYVADSGNNRIVVLAAMTSASPALGTQLASYNPTLDPLSYPRTCTWTPTAPST